MPKPTNLLTSSESEVMNVVWDLGQCTVADVGEQIARDLAYTTIMTTMRILEGKGLLRQCGKRGRAYVYAATMGRAEMAGIMTHEIADRLFHGSVKSLMLNMLNESEVDSRDLAEIRQLIETLEQSE